MTEFAETVAAILTRKRAGVDCTEEESATLKRWLDRYATLEDSESDSVATLFPLEYAEWCEDMEKGLRPQQFDGDDA